MSLTVTQLAWLLPIVALAFTAEAALGFGATVITLAIGAQVAPIATILPAFVPLNLLISATLLFRNRGHVDGRLLWSRVLPLMALGLPFGIFGLSRLDPLMSRRVFGLLVLMLSAFELWSAKRERPSPPQPRLGALALVAAGAIHGAFATGGPLVVWALGRRMEKAAFRATLSALWLALNIVLVTGYVANDRIDAGSLGASLTLGAGMLVGLWAGELVFRRAPPERFRVAVYVLLAVAGLTMLRWW